MNETIDVIFEVIPCHNDDFFALLGFVVSVNAIRAINQDFNNNQR